MKRKQGKYLEELKIFISADKEGAEDYTFNRLTSNQKKLAEFYMKRLNDFATEMSEITGQLKRDIVNRLKEKGRIRIEIETIGSAESKRNRELIIYKTN